MEEWTAGEPSPNGGEATTEPQSKYSVRLSGPGITIERDVDEEKAFQIIGVAMGVSAAAAAARPVAAGQPNPAGSEPSAQSMQPDVSIGEFLSQTGARSNTDKILAIGVHLTDYRDKQRFTREDVRGEFELAGETRPSNLPRDFQATLTNRWIAAVSGAPGEYYVTNTGREALKAGFPKESRRRPRRKSSKAKQADES